MIERLLENWLTNTHERAYMVSFCQLLLSKGYSLLYISPHGMEEAGKDIITRNKQGKLEAFQLKTGDIGLAEWRSIFGEIEELIKQPIQHPSVQKTEKFQCFIVTNGRIKDPVRTRITEQNNVNWREKRKTELKYIDRDQLLADYLANYGKFIPTELNDFKSFLEFYLADGSDMFPKEKFTDFLLNFFSLNSTIPTTSKATNLIASSVIITSYCLHPWSVKKNYIAEIEGWVCLMASILGLVTKTNLDKKYWQSSLQLVEQAIEAQLSELLNELRKRKHLVEGNWPTDGIVYSARTSLVLGFISAYPLYRQLKKEVLDVDTEKEIVNLSVSFENKMQFWGESCLPLFFSYYWLNEKYRRIVPAVTRLAELFRALVDTKTYPEPNGWPNPYYGIEQSLRLLTDFDKSKEYFCGQPYSLMTLIETVTRRNARKFLESNWRRISHIQHLEFVPEFKWQFFLWKSPTGVLTSIFPNQTQSWKELRKQSFSEEYGRLPEILIENPHLLLLFTIVYPHRFTSEVALLLENNLSPQLIQAYKQETSPTTSEVIPSEVSSK